MSKNNFEKYLPSLYGEGKEENNKEIEKKENSNSFKEKIKSLGKKALPYIAAASTLLALSKDTQAQRENKDNKPKQEYVLTTPDGKQIKFKSLEEELKYGKENNYIINQVDKENNTITYYYPSGEVEKYNLKDKTKIEDKKVEKEKNVKDNKDSLDIMEISLKPGHNGWNINTPDGVKHFINLEEIVNYCKNNKVNIKMQEGFTVLGEGRIINTETQKPIKIKFVDNNNNQNIKIEQNNKPQNEKIIQNRNERQINGLNIKTPKGIEHVSSIEEVKQIAKRDQVIISLINGYKVYPDGKILDKDNNIATNIRSFSDLYNLDFKEQEISNKQSQETNQTENNTQSSDITEAINTIPKGKGKILKIGNGHAEIYKIKKKGRVVKIKKKGEMGVISGN